MSTLYALVLGLALVAPTHTPTPPPTATPSPTYTPAPTQTARVLVVTQTVTLPTDTPPATGAYSGTVPLSSDNQGPGWGFGLLGTLHWFDFFGSLASGLVGWVIGAINGIVNAVTGILTAVVRVDEWPGLAGFFDFLLTVGGGIAAALCVLGTLRYYRSLLPGGGSLDGAAGLAMLTRTLETAALLLGLGWGIGQLLDLLQALSDAVASYTTIDGAALLTGMLTVFTGPALNAINALVGLVAGVVYALVVLVKLGSVATLAWLLVVSPLCASTWTIGPAIMAAWLRSFVCVGLWGAGWGVWLKVATLVLVDYSIPSVLKPFLVLALLLMGYGVPHLVDGLFQTGMARASGAFRIANGVATALVSAVRK